MSEDITNGGSWANAYLDLQDALDAAGSGTITDPDSDRVGTYQAIGPILVNQGLANEHFDIDFPVGTEVHDEIQDKEYVVK